MKTEDITENPMFILSGMAEDIVNSYGNNDDMGRYVNQVYRNKRDDIKNPRPEKKTKKEKTSLIQRIRNSITGKGKKDHSLDKEIDPEFLHRLQDKPTWQEKNADYRLTKGTKGKKFSAIHLAEEINQGLDDILKSKEMRTIGYPDTLEEIRDKAWKRSGDELNKMSAPPSTGLGR